MDAHPFADNRISKHIAVVQEENDVFRVNVNFYPVRREIEGAPYRYYVVDFAPTKDPYINGGLFTMPLMLGRHADEIFSVLNGSFVERGEAVILHVHDPYLLGLASKLSKRFPGSRIVYDRHEYYETWRNRLGVSVPGWYERIYGKSADELVFVARRLDVLPKVFFGKKVTVIPNYPLANAFDERAVDEKLRSLETSNDIEAIYFGALNLDFDRDIATMFQVVSSLMRRIPQVRFTLAGKLYDPRVKKMIDDLIEIFGDRVRYLGEIPYKEVVRRTAQAHIGFFLLRPDSTMWSDERPVSPNKIFEYLLSGVVPVVRANLDDKELLEGCALNFDRSSTVEDIVGAILTLISDRRRMRGMMERCLERGRKFSWESASRGYLECYERLFASMGKASNE